VPDRIVSDANDWATETMKIVKVLLGLAL